MVQPMVDNFNECKFVNRGTIMATGDKQQPLSAKKSVLRDLPNETRNIILKSPGNSPLPKDKTPVADTMKVSGTQKQQASFPASSAHPQSLGSNGINGHLVYVRRKLETDSGKINNNNSNSRKHDAESGKFNDNSSDSPALKKCKNDCMSEPKQQPELAQEASASPLPVPTNASAASLNSSSVGSTPSHSNGKTINGQPGPASNCFRAPIGSPVHPEPQKLPAAIPIQPETRVTPARISFKSEPLRPRDQQWKERFGQLQMFLKACDQSKQEEYIHKLRSLSAAGRSRHAYELEKRAIQLTLEEGKELHRVRVLNVLNKTSPDRHASIPAHIRLPMEVVPEEQVSGCH